MAGKPGTNNGGGARLFKGRPHEWNGAEKGKHPWAVRTHRIVLEREALAEAIEALDGTLTVRDVDRLGIHCRPIDDHTPDHAYRAEVDRFVESRRLDHAGVDRVLAALDRTRYKRDAEGEKLMEKLA